MLNLNQDDRMTEREIMDHEWEVDMFNRQSNHQVKIKQLEIDEQKLEAKWASWFRIPLYILSIPVRILFVIPLCIYVAKGQEIPEQFWLLVK